MRLTRLGLHSLALALCIVSAAWAQEPGLLHDWTFSPAHTQSGRIDDLAGDCDATIIGAPVFLRHPDRLRLDGVESRVLVSDDLQRVPLPKREITLEAWACIDVPGEWGGLVSAVQDNGPSEKGWVLGNRRGHFAFALSTTGADDGDGKITYLEAAADVPQGTLCHVVGVYDGARMCIYVNGRREGSSQAQSGDILYPPKTWVELGAYHDDDELLRLNGTLAQVRIYSRALTEDEVRERLKQHEALMPAPYPFSQSPWVRHVKTGEVVVNWRTEQPKLSVLEYGPTEALGARVRESEATREHSVHLTGLEPDTDYYYRIALVAGPDAAAKGDAPPRPQVSEFLTLDSSTDILPSVAPSSDPYPPDALSDWYRRAAEHIVKQAGVTRGYCLDLGCGDGRLAYEVARLTDLQIIGLEPDARKVAQARKLLAAAGLYGVRVTVRQSEVSKPTIEPQSINLIISQQALADGMLPARPDDLLPLLRPYGGLICMGQPEGASALPRLTAEAASTWLGAQPAPQWQVNGEAGLWLTARTDAPAGAGNWTHEYADAGNTACSGDELAAPLRIHWYGKPGPRNMVDRHHRAQGALVLEGRIFIPGNNRVLSVDAYNGTVLWDVEIPYSRRVGAMHDCGQMIATADRVYIVARDKCLALNTDTGEPELVMSIPPSAVEGETEWGYVACDGDMLVGSSQKRGAARTGLSREAVAEGTYYDDRPTVCSRTVFALDRHTGRERWVYSAPGGSRIINPAIALGDGAVYFIESRGANALASPDGRLRLDVLTESGTTFLTKLSLADGACVWSQPIDISGIRNSLFLCYAKGIVTTVGSRNENDHPRYDLWGHDGEEGRQLWQTHYNLPDLPPNGGHGEQDQHPVVVGETLYSRPFAFDLRTGAQQQFTLNRGGHGCGGLSASANYLYGRGGNPRMYPLGQDGSQNLPLTRVTRPGCWVNTIPAGGLVLIPESSSGCTCAYSLQTSLGLIPTAP